MIQSNLGKERVAHRPLEFLVTDEMGHFRQKSAILFFINFAEYPHLAFLTNDSLIVSYVTYNTVCLSRTVGSVDVMLRIYHFYQTFVAMHTLLQP